MYASAASPKNIALSPRKKSKSTSSSKHSSENFSFADVHDEKENEAQSNPLHDMTIRDPSKKLHSILSNPVNPQKFKENKEEIERLEKQIREDCVTLRRYNALLKKRGIRGLEKPKAPVFTRLITEEELEKQIDYISKLNDYLEKCSNTMNESNVNDLVKRAVTEARRKRGGNKSRRRRRC